MGQNESKGQIPTRFSEVDAKPSWYNKTTWKTYTPGSKLLPHQIRYSYAIGALEECRIQEAQGHTLSLEQREFIDNAIKKERKEFIGWDITGWLGTATNIAVFVPLLVQAITQPTLYQNLALIWISLINQIIFLVYSIGIRSFPILILSIILLPLMIVLVALVYHNLTIYPASQQTCH